uniref:Uncharacterized protein MANES_03G190000 n=1 Tax=Rhizophora mucronata TaxID=61149 RepID=A0A2P2JWU6_RHIMU
MAHSQKPVLIMNNSMEAPIKAEPTAIFTYQSRNFIPQLFIAIATNKFRYRNLDVP